MQKGDIWKDGGEMEEYLAMSQFAADNGLMFARNADGDFEIMDMPAMSIDNGQEQDDKDAKIAALEQRISEMEEVIASLI